MRRTVSLLLSFVMVFALTACGQSATSKKREEIQTAAQRTEEKPDIEVETELTESVSAEEQEADGKRFEGEASKEYVEDWIGEIGMEVQSGRL